MSPSLLDWDLLGSTSATREEGKEKNARPTHTPLPRRMFHSGQLNLMEGEEEDALS